MQAAEQGDLYQPAGTNQDDHGHPIFDSHNLKKQNEFLVKTENVIKAEQQKLQLMIDQYNSLSQLRVGASSQSQDELKNAIQTSSGLYGFAHKQQLTIQTPTYSAPRIKSAVHFHRPKKINFKQMYEQQNRQRPFSAATYTPSQMAVGQLAIGAPENSLPKWGQSPDHLQLIKLYQQKLQQQKQFQIQKQQMEGDYQLLKVSGVKMNIVQDSIKNLHLESQLNSNKIIDQYYQ